MVKSSDTFAGSNSNITEDEKAFGKDAWVYCSAHLRPHSTGWCTVPLKDKVKLDATTYTEALHECKVKGFKVVPG